MGVIPLLAGLALLIPGAGPDDPDDPAARVADLAAPRYAERQAAAAALVGLGERALPALRAARGSDDAEVRARAAELIARIEADLLVRPTIVHLDFTDTPLPEAVAGLAAAADIPVMLDPRPGDIWAGRRVTLAEPVPVTFWDAIDLLCRKSNLRSEIQPMEPPGRGVVLGVMLGEAGSRRAPASRHGPFRITAPEVQLRRALDLEPRPAHPVRREQFVVRLVVAAEPRLQIGQAAPLRLTIADDDRGQSLLLNASADPDTPEVDVPPIVEFAGGGSLPILVPLRHPGAEGRTIRRLAGVVPLVVAARAPDPLIASLERAAGRAFLGDDLILTVYAIRADPGTARTALELGLRPRPGAGDADNSDTPAPGRPAGLDLDRLDRRFEAVDRAGRSLSAYVQTPRLIRGEVRLRLLLIAGDGVGSPLYLKVYGINQARAEVPFDLRDIPIP